MTTLTIDTITGFVGKTHPYAKHWPKQIVTDWIAFFIANDLIAVVTETGERIDGLLLFRPVASPQEGQDQSRINHDPKGNTVWLDYCYATSRHALRGLTVCAARRMGKRDLVAWERTLSSDRKLPLEERRSRLEVVTVKHFFQHYLPKGVI